ncbi:MAG: DegQ family serine endoprotease [Betaproteobacteria bacterium]
MKQRMLVRSLIAAGALSIAAIGGYESLHTHPGIAAVPVAASAAAATPLQGPVVVPNFSAIAAQSGPAVVNISVIARAERTSFTPDQSSRLDPDDPFSQFFRQFGGARPRAETPMRGTGSGFIVSPDGIVLTNAHVVADANTVTVKLTDKREFKAKVVGFDRASDVAVLKIDAKGLPTVKLPTSDEVAVGEWVLAIGSPFGFENSVTAGIVSAKARSLPDGSYVPFIQTDAAVNPGNSGGPLLNVKGEVIGINSQIFSHSGGFQGLSFAIPIDVAINVENQILKNGKVSRGQLGITIQDINQSLAESFGLKRAAGALVSSVTPGGPAAKAGVLAGDVILRYNDRELTNSSELPVQVARAAPGSKASLEVLRKGETKRLDVTLGEVKDGKVAAATPGAESHGRLGLAARSLSPEERKQAGVDGGVVVEQVTGPAAEAGIQQGDVVLSINGNPIKSAEEMRSLVAKAGKHVALLVQRDEVKIFVPIDLG